MTDASLTNTLKASAQSCKLGRGCPHAVKCCIETGPSPAIFCQIVWLTTLMRPAQPSMPVMLSFLSCQTGPTGGQRLAPALYRSVASMPSSSIFTKEHPAITSQQATWPAHLVQHASKKCPAHHPEATSLVLAG